MTTFDAAGHRFELSVPDPDMGRRFEALLAALADVGSPAGKYVVERDGVDGFHLRYDGTSVANHLIAGEVFPWLLWHVNQSAIAAAGDRLALHAAVLADGDRAVILPGQSGAGKSTLAAALLRAGLSYLSDELALLDPSSRRVSAYPKPLSIDTAPDEALDPEVVSAIAPPATAGGTWHVGIRRCVPTASAAVLVFPEYRAEAATDLSPLSVQDSLVRLTACAFGLEADLAGRFRWLARLAAEVPAYALVSSDAASGARAVLDVLTKGAAAGLTALGNDAA